MEWQGANLNWESPPKPTYNDLNRIETNIAYLYTICQ